MVEAVVEDHYIKAGLLSELGAIVDSAGDPRQHDLVAVDRAPGAGQRASRALSRAARVQPGDEDEARRADLPAGGERRDPQPRAGGLRGLREDAGRGPRTCPGFVVNRLLFPYLFSAVRLVEETGMEPADVDTCMKLGAGHPMGPLALLDLVGLDVSEAIGETIGEHVPARIEVLIAEEALGRKSGRGFHAY